MKLYDIYNEIANLFITDENGEVADDVMDKFAELQMAEEEKIENTTLYYKNLLADASAIKNEIDNLTARYKAKSNKAERIKTMLENYFAFTQKESFETAKCKIGFRKSSSVLITDEDAIPSHYKKWEYTISKSDIKKDLGANVAVTGACLQEKKNIQIK